MRTGALDWRTEKLNLLESAEIWWLSWVATVRLGGCAGLRHTTPRQVVDWPGICMNPARELRRSTAEEAIFVDGCASESIHRWKSARRI